jgi:endonuclease/exonuclease/phosphatase family metal-dependent hydrolase
VLRVLTLNLWGEAGPWPERAACIRDWIGRLDPDLIAFQELAPATRVDVTRELLASRPYPLARDDAGNAIASRWPIRESAMTFLPGADGADARAALVAEIASPHGTVALCTTHLDWGESRVETRTRQLAALSALVREAAARADFPAILAGDLNALPESAEILELLRGRTRWQDAWRVAGDGGPGYTCASRNPYARLTGEPDRRIDYVLVGEPQSDGRGRVATCRVVCDEPCAGVWASDHFGVYAELRTAITTQSGSASGGERSTKRDDS